jgi:Ca-activated chloride channel family protein
LRIMRRGAIGRTPAMRFLSAYQLWLLLLLLPLLVIGYLWLQAKRKRIVLGYSNLGLVRQALAGTATWRRHIPPTILLIAIASMIIAGARPVMDVLLPTARKTIVLAMDVSGSMQATDVYPTRLAASQAAAKEFVSNLPEAVRVAVVAYAGSAHLVQAPTRDRAAVMDSIDAFQLQRATAIGNGIIVALGTIFPAEGIDVSSFSARGTKYLGSGDEIGLAGAAVGSYGAAAIVLLSDGQNTSGIDPIEAARFAARRGVRIYTVGFGTRQGATINMNGWTMRVQLDEDALKKVARLTGAAYYRASDQMELSAAYEALTHELVMEKAEREVSGLFANIATVLTLLAAALSIAWFGRVA